MQKLKNDMVSFQKHMCAAMGIPDADITPSASTGFYYWIQEKIEKFGNIVFWFFEIVIRIITILPIAILAGIWYGVKDNIEDMF